MKPSTQHENRRSLTWLTGSGGPFVVLPRSHAAQWRGVLAEADPTDFDRACSVDDYLGVIEHRGTEVLVLGDDPFPTTFLAAPSFGGGYFVRLLWGDDMDAAIAAVHALPREAWTTEELVFNAGRGSLVLFDAAQAGDETIDRVPVKLGPSSYAIASADVQSDESMCLLVHRLVPIA